MISIAQQEKMVREGKIRAEKNMAAAKKLIAPIIAKYNRFEGEAVFVSFKRMLYAFALKCPGKSENLIRAYTTFYMWKNSDHWSENEKKILMELTW